MKLIKTETEIRPAEDRKCSVCGADMNYDIDTAAPNHKGEETGIIWFTCSENVEHESYYLDIEE